MHKLPETVKAAIWRLSKTAKDPLSAFVYDLPALQSHIQYMIEALPPRVELFYAIKANSDRAILNTLAPWVHGFEISSGGEIERLQACEQTLPFIFSGPGKLDSELTAALENNVTAIHIESLQEIVRLQSIASRLQRVQTVFLRINPSLPEQFSSRLTMAGRATPFGVDEKDIGDAIRAIEAAPNLSLQGFHVHAMSHQGSLDKHKALIAFYLARWQEWRGLAQRPENITHMNVGGGIGVNYMQSRQFDWPAFCEGLDGLLKSTPNAPVLRFEPGRFISAFCGYYVMQVLDKKHSHGEAFLIARGGTHQFRLPVAQGHDHPVIHLPIKEKRPVQKQTWTLVGQLCTPKDVLSRDVALTHCEVGDLLVLPLAGAYGYNISHVDFLCHPRPNICYLPLSNHGTCKDSSAQMQEAM